MRISIFLAGFVASTIALSTSAGEEKQVLWGDTHLHTNYSFDAFLNNNLTADPDTAYRYAKGVPVVHPYNKTRVQIDTPLDFLVVSDHAVYLGVMREIYTNGVDTSDLGWWDSIKAIAGEWYYKRTIDRQEGRKLFGEALPPPSVSPREAAADASSLSERSSIPTMRPTQVATWQAIAETADQHNQPGDFTAFIGWEWSSIPSGANLHRVVISDGDAASAKTYQPFSTLDSQVPEDLWDFLDQVSVSSGADFIAIPHNSNISKGYMFDETGLRGQPFTEEYLAQRMKWERLAEITQLKGDSETHPDLSPEDEFADFESYPYYIQNGYTPYVAGAGDYVRSGLKRGLAIEQEKGINPYKFGVIGSTDAHTGLPTAEESNFWGKFPTDSIPANKQGRWIKKDYPQSSGWAMSASGLAAVWSTENTREAILAAMKRRETYATTGPRIGVQFYGGTDFSEEDMQSADLYQRATAKGVPMGGELAGLSESPSFIVAASKGPIDANLDRIQIIKGWVDSSGEQHEKVHNVAWSDDRQLDAAGKLPAVGNTVDTSDGSYTNNIGAEQLSSLWTDPNFDASQRAFYYVRVLQIPTPRHSLLDAIALEMEHATDQPDTIQERAYTSSIWYNP
jgi:hypothetical protein